MTDVVEGTSLYLRNMHGAGERMFIIEREAALFAKRAKAMGLSWVAIGAVWQEPNRNGPGIGTKFLNTPAECRAYAKALRDVGVRPFVWGYPWLGAEQRFVDGMAECAGDDAEHVLDPELGMNPARSTRAAAMALANVSAGKLVRGLRGAGAKTVLLSTYGGVPKWFPLRAFLEAGVDGAGGQTYTDDAAVDTSIASFEKEMRVTSSSAQLVPNFGVYARDQLPDGTSKVRSKTPAELRKHLDEFINEGENVRAAIGWAENFLTPALELELARFSARLRERCSRV